MSDKQKREKIFLNSMDSWFSNFIIESFRTDYMPESKLQTEFMGTINDEENIQLPLHFNPQIFTFDYNPAYKSELFSNDIFIYNLNSGNIKEINYLLKGLKTLRFDSEKILIIISNIMTWAKTPNKIKSDNPDEIVFIHPEDVRLEEQRKLEELRKLEEQKRLEEQRKLEEEQNKEQNENNEEQNNNEENKEKDLNENNPDNNNTNNNEQENKEQTQNNENEKSGNNSVLKEKSVNESKLSNRQNQSNMSQSKENKEIKEEKEVEEIKPIIVYWTEKDYLNRKPAIKYMEYKFVENEALLLNQKLNIKSYVICPGVVYGYGERTFYSIFRNALLGFPIEEILLDKGRNIIPTIHMKDLVNIISKVIEKKPSSHYILAFDQTNDRCLKSIIKSIYHCIGDETIMCPQKEEEIKDENEEKEENEENNEENEDKNENNEENEENKEGEDSEEQKITESKKMHPYFSNKKYVLPENFPKDLLYLDVKILPSEFLKGEVKEKERYYSQLSLDEEEKPPQYIPLFKWHCPNGIISNMHSLRKEFIKYRNLNTNKIFILGNPYTGKTTISKILSKIFHLPIIDTKSIVNFGKKLAGIEEKKIIPEENNNNPEGNNNNMNENENNNNNINENPAIDINNNAKKDEFAEYIRKSSTEKDLIYDIQKTMKDLDEGRAEAEEAYNKRPNKKKTDPPFDDNMYYRFNDDLMVNILKRRLEENDSFIYGFIIDGFPKNYSQAKKLFKISDNNLANPNSILLFENIEDDYAINRIKASEDFPKDPKDPNVNMILERANRRLNRLKEEKNAEGYKSLHDFFEEEENKKIFNDKIKIINGKNTIMDIIKDIQEFIIKNNDNKINQIDEELECKEYEYDYVKIEEEKRKLQEEQAQQPEQKEDPQKKLIQNLSNKNVSNIINNNVNDNNQKKEEENKDKDKDKEKMKKSNDNTKKEETIYEETQDILNTKEGEELNEIKEEEKEKKVEEEEKPKTQLEIEKENEFKLLEKKSEVIRRYLAENVLPLLSLGILYVANKRPDDPVEALADYLLAKTFEKKNIDGEFDDNIKIEKDNNDIDDKNNISLDLNLDGEKDDDVKLNLGTILDKDQNKDKLPRNLSPIHRDNSNADNIEDVLNKGMIDSDE